MVAVSPQLSPTQLPASNCHDEQTTFCNVHEDGRQQQTTFEFEHSPYEGNYNEQSAFGHCHNIAKDSIHSGVLGGYHVTSQDHNHYLFHEQAEPVARGDCFHSSRHVKRQLSDLDIENSQCDSSSNSNESSPDGQIILVPSPPGNSNHGDQSIVSKDQQHGHHSSTNRQARGAALEQKHVHDVYEKTAHHFKKIRFKAWPKVRQFLQELEPGSLVADVGGCKYYRQCQFGFMLIIE